MSSPSRLRWLCRRGMKELDDLLSRYLEQHYPAAPEHERQAFEALLELQDPDLFRYVIGRDLPTDAAMADVIAKIRRPADP